VRERSCQLEDVRIGGRVWSSVSGSVSLSHCERYRYHLARWWGPGDQHILWVMLNPSTADERRPDPTVARCLDYSARWGFSHVHVCNLFALRTTDPRKLYVSKAPEGPRNDDVLSTTSQAVMSSGGWQIAAWGAHGALRGRGRAVAQMLASYGELRCLTVTKGGHPGHPLYLRRDVEPFWFPPDRLSPPA